MDKRYFIVHGKTSCPYCVNAVSLLEERNINYIFSQVTPESRQVLQEQYEWPTVPVVVERSLFDGTSENLIGGFDDLCTYLDTNTEESGASDDVDSSIDRPGA